MNMNKLSFSAVIFDLDGVITRTALVHSKAWKNAFEEYLHLREKRYKEVFREFTHNEDYIKYVDGKPRYEGVRSFLESRGINIPYGDPSDAPGKETICGIGNKKNDAFREVLEKGGAEVYNSTIEFIKVLKNKGIRIGVASSSKNCRLILQKSKIEDLFETRVDGEVSVELGLKGKPEGDIFVTAARNLGFEPANAVVVEDAISGVQAGRNGGFGLVLGLARKDNKQQLIDNGADIAVNDLSEITLDCIEDWFNRKPAALFPAFDKDDGNLSVQPNQQKNKCNAAYNTFAENNVSSIISNQKKKVIFLDYDGTLTPIVKRPELAVLSDDMRDVLKELSKTHMVSIVSGRMREDVQNLVGINYIFYAGSHGFDILGPGFSMIHSKAQEVIPVINELIQIFKKKFDGLKGLLVEEKKFSVAVHYRLVNEKHIPGIIKIIDDEVRGRDSIRTMNGKKVFEVLPDIDWNKGKAIRWILEALKISWSEALILYIGDDVTDEYAFRAVRTRGIGVLVSDIAEPSSADFQLSTTDDVKKLFERMIGTS
ncbi:MAG: trehalose-phosphatase [bacterium]